MKKIAIFACLFFIGCMPHLAVAQTAAAMPDMVSTVKAKVLAVESQSVEAVPGTTISSIDQTIRVEILEGEDQGNVVTIDNDFIALTKGEVFYLQITSQANGQNTYAVSEPYRIPVLLYLIGFFVILVVLFGGMQGIRGLLGLTASLLLIFYVLIPAILHGYSPLWIGLAVSTFIIVLGSYITHGFNKTTTAAIIGMIITILFTGTLAYISVHAAHFSGFSTEETVYLNMDTSGSINFLALLLAGIIIGLLGILYDVAIGQAVSVEELHTVAPHLSRRIIYERAIRIGKEHIGALVNILAIAYVGVSLPLILLYIQSSPGPAVQIINKELFATEIVRTMIGSIGLILAVPITTIIAVFLLIRKPKDQSVSPEEQKKEQGAIEHIR